MMTENRTIVPGEIEGFLSGCPFCTSQRIGIPEVGTRFRIISGLQAGFTGTVIEWTAHIDRPDNQFMAQLDREPPDCQTLVSTERQIIQLFLLCEIPEWAPPLSMVDAGELDKQVVSFCHSSLSWGKWKTNWSPFNRIIGAAWRNRLPLEPEELWSVLRAHGVPENEKRDLLDYYEKGRTLLIYATGKGSRKKKRVEPLSIPSKPGGAPNRHETASASR